ncbi:DDHD domain protein [Aspergillus flavus]|uniref:DDHD domain protein n=1 Tax=Aspergillus flavus TaxID=5059 RepID=A0AB74CNL0_ASPFL|nr:DDHD domain protein [Aspergillus flavus]RAQ68064.1 DDHD domain protein [Aspergillus flavus]RAQ73704.1 DDHD domain protein [Aspergillus flavus]RMZ47862.1 DDHD domain protein [Aspergillus flavus]
MSKESKRGTFLGAISPWNVSRSTTPQPDSGCNGTPDILQRSQGQDHTVTHRHRLSPQRYPKDCPSLRVRWFYAVDSPKWKPALVEQKKDASKPLPPPKKFVPFSVKDSQAIEIAFQNIAAVEGGKDENKPNEGIGEAQELTKVPVNEDYLFDVDVERRELSPAYWIGPVYEVRRGTWFVQDGSTIKPCEENLATQLEEGYLKVKPWRFEEVEEPSTLRDRTENAGHMTHVPANSLYTYRLFGAYMNSLVTYQDSSTALLTNDDFMSRVSTTVYQKLGGVPGTRLVRGFSETKRQKEAPDSRNPNRRSNQGSVSTPEARHPDNQDHRVLEGMKPGVMDSHLESNSTPGINQRSTLERQMSSLAGEPQNPADIEEQARRQEEKEMEDSRQGDGNDRDREIDHLVLVTHGIGQRLGLRLESINFIHDVNVLRKTMKNVYKVSPDLQALNSTFGDKHENCRVQVLPVCWRHLLDFPYRGVRQNRKELDLADADILEDDPYPGLADITLDSVPAVRNLISDLAMDVLLYQSVASSLLNRSLGLSSEDIPQNPPASATLSQQSLNTDVDLANRLDRHPTLIDSDLETLYDGFQKIKSAPGKSASAPASDDAPEHQGNEIRMKRLRTEDAKVRSLNSNGRVDYSIQEGAFDISMIASIASHLTYWADEDVNHFMLSQMLSRRIPPREA